MPQAVAGPRRHQFFRASLATLLRAVQLQLVGGHLDGVARGTGGEAEEDLGQGQDGRTGQAGGER